MQIVTKENFKEYEEKVCRTEHRRSIAKKASLIATMVFCVTPLPVYISIFCLMDPDEAINDPTNPWIFVLIGKLWKRFLPNGCPWPLAILLPILAVILIFLVIHVVATVVLKLVYVGKTSAPLGGSDVEKAEKLYERYNSVSASSYDFGDACEDSDSPSIVAAVIFCGVCFALIMLGDGLEENFLLFLFALGVMGLIVFGICRFLHGFCLWLVSFFFYPHRDSKLADALKSYMDVCKKEEQERKRAEEAAVAEQNRKRGDALYQQAIAHDEADENLIKQAAALGSRPACLYMGKLMYRDFTSDYYTKKEKERIAEEGKHYLYIASQEENSEVDKIEAEFLYLAFRVITEGFDADGWKAALTQLRNIQRSGLLQEELKEPCALLISQVVEMVDKTPSRSTSGRSNNEPAMKYHCYCRFYSAGTCSMSSDDSYTAKCYYASNPGQCSICTTNNALEFVFE